MQQGSKPEKLIVYFYTGKAKNLRRIVQLLVQM